MHRQQHLELAIERQERLQQVLLRPRQPHVHDPLARVLVREEDVVEVHDHADRQARHALQQQVIDVAAGLDRVGGVDEQHVARLQRRVLRRGNFGGAQRDDLDA